MIREEPRVIKILECDFCGEGMLLPQKCAVCGKDMCLRDGEKAHVAYVLLQVRKIQPDPGDEEGKASGIRVCKKCATQTFNLPLGELLEGLMKEGFSFEPFRVRR